MNKRIWLLAVPWFLTRDVDTGKYDCVAGNERINCMFPACDESKDRCEDFAEALNAARERRTKRSDELSAEDKEFTNGMRWDLKRIQNIGACGADDCGKEPK